MSYQLTGVLHGQRYSRDLSDYTIALMMFEANPLKSLWEVKEDGTKKLLMRRKEKVVNLKFK